MPYEQMSRAALSLAAALALILPAPAAAQGQVFVPLCNGGTLPLPVGQGDNEDNDRKNCRIACHASDNRRTASRRTR
jgi:hypothetical protein